MHSSARAGFDDIVRWRRDVRRFRIDPIDPGLVRDMLELADLAPSVGNSQPWRIVLVEAEARRAHIRRLHEAANAAAAAAYEPARRLAYERLKLAGFDRAPLHLAVFCDECPEQGHGLGRVTMPESLSYSCAGMINTLWLVARSRGIGLGWVSILAPEQVAPALGIGEPWRFIGYLLLGYPQEEHLDPELERFGWQPRTPLADRVFRV